MIDESKYEGHTEGKWEYVDATIHATAKGGNEIIAEYPCWNYNKDQLITKEEKANLLLMTDAPLLLVEVIRLREENDTLGEAVKEDNEILKKHIETLAEVKRLREQLAKANKYVHTIRQHSVSMLMDYHDYMKGDEEE